MTASQTDPIVYHLLVLFHDIPHYSHTLGIFTDIERVKRLKQKITDTIRESETVKTHLGKYRVRLEIISISQEDVDKVLHIEYSEYIKMNPAKDAFMELASKAPDSHSWFGYLHQGEVEFQEKVNSIVICDQNNNKGTQTHPPVINVVTHIEKNMAKCVLVGMFMSTLDAQRVQESLLYHHGLDVRYSTYDEKNFIELESFYKIDPECIEPDYIGLKHLFTT
jgi:hypothetical protein